MSDNAYRWSHAVNTSTVFTTEQAQRVQALRAAREVIENRKPNGPLTPVSTDSNAAYLIEVAQWIIDGKVPGNDDVDLSES